MPNKSLTIVVSTPRETADVTLLVKDVSTPRAEMGALADYFKRLEQGCDKGSGTTVAVSYSTSAPVAASGTIALTYASVANNDTVTVGGTVLTCVTGTPTGAQFRKVTDGPTTAINLRNLINSNTTTNKLFVATASASTVTVKAITFGVIGNKLTLATSNATGFVLSAATLASGAGGSEIPVVTYSRG